MPRARAHAPGRGHPFLDWPGPIPFAHRGGARYAPNLHRENTRHAFEQAAALGYRYFETDVHATADGVLLAFHDDRLDRVTDRTGMVAALPWAEVAEARIHGRDPIPRLAELLTQLSDALDRWIEAAHAVDGEVGLGLDLLTSRVLAL